MSFKRICFDLEANNLLHPMIDFTSMPYKLKKDSELYCLTLRDMDTDDNVLLLPQKYLGLKAPEKIIEYYTILNVTESPSKITGYYEYYYSDGTLHSTVKTKNYDPNCNTYSTIESIDEDGVEYNKLNKDILTKENVKKYFSEAEEIIGHNIINYDLPVLKLFDIFEYKIGYPGKPSFLFGREVKVKDTLLISKIYNPDRLDSYGKHSLNAFGHRTGSMKGDYTDFSHYNYKMGVYCNQDGVVTKQTYLYLDAEEDFQVFDFAYQMEMKVADQQVKQEAFGFYFDLDLAEKSIVELTDLIKNCQEKVEPHLPAKKLNKGEQSFYTPPKIQFKKNGDLSSAIRKFVEKVGATLVEKPSKTDPDSIVYYIKFNDLEYQLPFNDPILQSLPTCLKDGNVVKEYLIELGWIPSEWNIRDLTKDSKKAKCDSDKILANINRYVEETEVKGLFRKSRYEELELDPEKDDLKSYLIKKYTERPNSALKVSTTPPLRVGADKSLCPNLLKLSEQMGEDSYIQFIVDFHTYTHRKNSIAGGEIDEDGNPSKGFISFLREDGRVATPADTLGAATGRYLHRNICNIARGSSVYGKNMRSMFGCGPGLAQIGYDFSSLENVVQGHFILNYEGGPELAKALLAKKPNDSHSLNAKKLGLSRTDAKSITYALLYGAAAPKIKKMLGISTEASEKLVKDFWDAVPALRDLRDKVTEFWKATNQDYIPGIDGRKLRVRKEHSLINTLFQSGGALLVKWTTVRTAELLEEQGILGDPFEHTKEDKKVFQMIVYHDEVQYACHRDFLEVECFFDEEKQKQYEKDLEQFSILKKEWIKNGKQKSDEPKEPENPFEVEAKQWMKDNPTDSQYSDIGHIESGLHYVTKPNVISKTILQAIKDTEKLHSIRVPLGMEWITGANWYQCH